MKYIIIYGLMLQALTSCTYSITMVHTEGTASDVVDEDQKADANVSPNVSLPIKAI